MLINIQTFDTSYIIPVQEERKLKNIDARLFATRRKMVTTLIIKEFLSLDLCIKLAIEKNSDSYVFVTNIFTF